MTGAGALYAAAALVTFALGARSAHAEPATVPPGDVSPPRVAPAPAPNSDVSPPRVAPPTTPAGDVSPPRVAPPTTPAGDVSPRSETPLDLTTDTVCPASGAVTAALRDMLGLAGSDRLHEVARIAHASGALVVTLEDPDGRVLGERALPLEGTCDELARAAAVVLATWLGDAHPEFVPRFAPPSDTKAPSSPAPTGPKAMPPPNGTVRSSGAVRLESEWRLRVGAAIGAAVLPAPAAFAGTVSGTLVPDHDGVGATLRASALSSRGRDLPGGRARYFRWPLEAGAVARFTTRSVALELQGGGALGWLHVAGRSFSPDRSADDVTFGPFAAARVLAARGRVQPFAEVAGVFWLKASRVYADAAEPSVALPPAEMTLSLGAAFVP